MDDMTGEQLALPSDRVRAYTRHGPIVGGRVRNGVQVFLNVPYALPVSRWTDAAPLPPTYRYPEREYTVDGAYCAQPGRAYTAHIPVRQRLGLGQPTENPFFADIYVPSDAELECPPLESLERTGLRPVRVFVHGGFLQFGSTSGSTYNQQFFAAEHFGEVRVLLGHRVSALGFLASPRLEGNWGFKDVWLGIEWVQSNIAAFGGDPTQIHLSGLSGGAHIVHQLLHRAARGQDAAFVSATLQSNAILTDPLSRHAREDQFAQLASALGLDPNDPLVVERMRDREQIPTGRLIAAIEGMGTESTFRGVADDLHGRDQMAFQASGGIGAWPRRCCDLPIQHLRLSAMTEDEARLALEWHAAISAATQPALQGDGSAFVQKPEDQVLTLDESGVSWRRDWRWDTLRAAEAAVRPPQPLAHM
ncbi:hypothetical protein CcaverHIS002_0411520 [Cutaneotrichosporon cavernicola]|nr:hypothetical protein CcaverHIS002_0411520 [Cutaneotrichosporon cavernicola]